MSILVLLLTTILLGVQQSWGSNLMKNETKSCMNEGGEVLNSSHGYLMSRALCKDRWVFWLSKASKGLGSDSAVMLDKIEIRPLAKTEKFIDSYYCYFKGDRDKRLVFYGIFNIEQKGTVKDGKGKLIEGYVPDLRKKKLVALSSERIKKIVCELESEE